jgi:hypothetical protein
LGACLLPALGWTPCRRPQSVHITHLSLSRIEPQGQDLLMDVTFAQRGFPRVRVLLMGGLQFKLSGGFSWC